MSLRLKVAENQLEPLEISFTIQRLRVNTTMQKQCPPEASSTCQSHIHCCCYQEFLLFKQNISTILSASRGQNKSVQSPSNCHLRSVLVFKVSKGAKIRNRCNQVPHLTQDTNGKVTNSQLDTTNESQEVPVIDTRGK